MTLLYGHLFGYRSTSDAALAHSCHFYYVLVTFLFLKVLKNTRNESEIPPWIAIIPLWALLLILYVIVAGMDKKVFFLIILYWSISIVSSVLNY